MAISRKPNTPQTQEKVDVDALINRGGSVARTGPEKDKAISSVTLRVPDPILIRIDKALAARPIHTPRHTWLLEAVLEKLEREGQ